MTPKVMAATSLFTCPSRNLRPRRSAQVFGGGCTVPGAGCVPSPPWPAPFGLRLYPLPNCNTGGPPRTCSRHASRRSPGRCPVALRAAASPLTDATLPSGSDTVNISTASWSHLLEESCASLGGGTSSDPCGLSRCPSSPRPGRATGPQLVP